MTRRRRSWGLPGVGLHGGSRVTSHRVGLGLSQVNFADSFRIKGNSIAPACKPSPACKHNPACKDSSAQILLEPRARGTAMRGLARRLAAQTLSQILTFGLCASSTESAMQQKPQRPAPAAGTNASPNHVPAEERKLRDAILRIRADEKNARACQLAIRKRTEGQTELADARKGCAEPQRLTTNPASIDKICARQARYRLKQVAAVRPQVQPLEELQPPFALCFL